MFMPFSAMFSSKSSPESTPRASISSAEITDTGRAPVIDAPLICEPTTTTSSTSEIASASSCANTVVTGISSASKKKFLNFIKFPFI